MALVTGGTRGIGRAIAERLCDEQAQVIVCGRHEPAKPFADDYNEIAFMQANVSQLNQVKALIESTSLQYGRIDILVNNAGIEIEKTLEDTTEADWDQLMGINVKGVFLCSKFVIPQMRQQGGGVIINLSSISSQHSDKGMAAYNASKAAVNGLTRSIAVDHGSDGIRCNAICPGWIDTDMLTQTFSVAHDEKQARRDALANHPVGRLGTPGDIANLAAWLASNEASFIRGQLFTADGGLTAGALIDPSKF